MSRTRVVARPRQRRDNLGAWLVIAVSLALSGLLVCLPAVQAHDSGRDWTVRANPDTLDQGDGTDVELTVTNTSEDTSEEIGCVQFVLPNEFRVSDIWVSSLPDGMEWVTDVTHLSSGATLVTWSSWVGFLHADSDQAQAVFGIGVKAMQGGSFDWQGSGYKDKECNSGGFPDRDVSIDVTGATPKPTSKPVPTDTPDPTPRPTPRPTDTPGPTPDPTRTPSPTRTPRPTQQPTATPDPTPRPTPRPTIDPTAPPPTDEPTLEPTRTPRPTHRPHASNEPDATASPEPTPTEAPVDSARPDATPSPGGTQSGGGVPPGQNAGGGGGGGGTPDRIEIPGAPRGGTVATEVDVHSFDSLQSSFEFLVPSFAVSVPGLLVILAIAAQLAGGTLWLPAVRRNLGAFGFRRRRRLRA